MTLLFFTIAPKRGRKSKNQIGSTARTTVKIVRDKAVKPILQPNSSIKIHQLASASHFRRIAPNTDKHSDSDHSTVVGIPQKVLSLAEVLELRKSSADVHESFLLSHKGDLNLENYPLPYLQSFLTNKVNFRVNFAARTDGRTFCCSSLPDAFFDSHGKFLCDKRFVVEETIRAVSDAIQTVYQEQFVYWNAFMHNILVCGNVPVNS